jgi:hypothetical protein
VGRPGVRARGARWRDAAVSSESLALEDDDDDALNKTFGTEDGIGDDAATDEESDDDEIGYAGARGPPTPLALRADAKTAEEIEDARAIESAVDATAWKLELERVAPQLKVASAAAETKDWRAHLEQAKKAPAARRGGVPGGAGASRARGGGRRRALWRRSTSASGS